ncbi:CorA family divalent cation transporter [Clostridium aminobutyricum]|uniref:Magnesium transport protein CorA n=1 Tax=Clostridium aminobutyricum TaxID=33953 RepID=A0A939D676_CLOAM|nr:CorA family divalent cation transporter [Clostridium aminobutyricum]MBN7771801.1 hypothetical protein [Clostridium aminobutyricum]
MFYILNDRVAKSIELADLKENDISVGYLTLQDLETNIDRLEINENILHDCMSDQTHFRDGVDAYEDFSFGIINIVNVMDVKGAKDRVAFIIKKNQFILVKLIDEDDSCRLIFQNSVKRFRQNATLEKVIFGILDGFLVHGNEALEAAEQKILRMEQNLAEGKMYQELNQDIFHLRQELSLQKNYYEQLFDIGEDLQENGNGLFDEEVLHYFRVFTAKAERLSDLTQALSDSLIHFREALQEYSNYKQNNIMKVFTVVTTIFLPLNLIVGWYGMNFHMPELTWKYGYATVILLCIIVVISCFVIFKKKKFF